MSFTVRGTCAVFWKPAYTLTAESPDGTELDADGKEHDLIATLTKTVSGVPVPNRTLKLKTDPVDEVGHNKRKRTNSSGQVTFKVSNLDTESVEYTVSLVPRPATSSPTVADDLTIQWGAGYFLQAFPSDAAAGVGSPYGPVQMTLYQLDEVTPAVGVSCVVDPIGTIGVTDGFGNILFNVPSHGAGAVLYTLTDPPVSGGVPPFFTLTWS